MTENRKNNLLKMAKEYLAGYTLIPYEEFKEMNHVTDPTFQTSWSVGAQGTKCKFVKINENETSKLYWLIWEVMRSRESEIQEVIQISTDESWFYDIPYPVIALMCQRLAFITDSAETKKDTVNLMASILTPHEEDDFKIGLVVS